MLHGSIRKLALVSSIVALFAAISATSAAALPFEVETQAATNVGSYSATLNGRVFNSNGREGIAGYEYGTTTAYGKETTGVYITGKKGWIDVPVTIEGLQPNTTYHFRFGAVTNPGEVTMGADATFTTLPKAKFATGTSTGYPLDVSLASLASKPLSFGIEGGSFSCKTLTAAGSITAGDVIFGKSAQVTLTPSFADCTALGLLEVAVNTNGCSFVLHAGDSGTATGEMDIACPSGKAIDVVAGSCKFSLSPQTGLAPITEANDVSTAPDSVSVGANAGGLDYVKTQDGMLCPFSGTGAKSDGTLTGSASLTGSSEGTPEQIQIVH